MGGVRVRILLVEDEKSLSAAICQVLKREHFTVDTAFTGPHGLNNALSGIYDAVILDVMLPCKDSFSILKELRENGIATPVMMLTARGDLEDRVRGLNGGADYYLPKPFQMAELLACLRTITRRRDTVPMEEMVFGDAELLSREGKLLCRKTGQSVKLGAKELQLLELLFRNPGQILSKETLIERVWGFESEAEYNNLEVYFSFIRKKLTFVGSRIKIKAARGLGYSLEDAP
jgi:DNA-binding response OmpR family regulator